MYSWFTIRNTSNWCPMQVQHSVLCCTCIGQVQHCTCPMQVQCIGHCTCIGQVCKYNALYLHTCTSMQVHCILVMQCTCITSTLHYNVLVMQVHCNVLQCTCPRLRWWRNPLFCPPPKQIRRGTKEFFCPPPTKGGQKCNDIAVITLLCNDCNV